MKDWKDKSFQEAIFNAYNNKSLVLFIGAGLSSLCGIPRWNELASILLNACVNEPACHFDCSYLEQVKKSIDDPRELVSIAWSFFKKAGKINWTL